LLRFSHQTEEGFIVSIDSSAGRGAAAPSPTSGAGAPHAERRRTLVVAALGTFVALALFTVPMGSLSSVADALGAGPGGQTWILSSMSVGLAAGLLIAGVLADDFGRRRLFWLGAVLVAVTLVIGASAGSTLVFVLARIGQGVGSAALVSGGLGLIGHTFPAGHDRTRATGVWGASVGAGIAVGPPFGVLLAEAGGWRAPYLLLVPFALGLALAARLLLVESKAARPHPVDLSGALLLGTGSSALLIGLITGRTGWVRPETLLPLVGGVLLLAGFGLVEWVIGRRGGAPLLDLALLRRPDFMAVTAAGLATGLGVISVMTLAPTIASRGLDSGPLLASMAVVTWSGVSVPVALLARRLRVNGDVQLAGGLLVVAVGLVLLTGLHPGDGFGRLLPGLVVAGLGSGVLNAALGRQAVASVPAGRAGMGSGANNTARYLGSAIGVTIAAVLATRPGAGGLLAGWNASVLVAVVFSVLGVVVVLACRRATRRTEG
jgi:MFS family permease